MTVKQSKHVVYFIRRQDGLIKIGTTTNLQLRLSALETAHGKLDVLKVVNGGTQKVRAIHRKFKRLNEFGEWFRPSDELSAWIAGVDEGGEVVTLATEQQQVWEAAEVAMTEEARQRAERLIQLQRQFFGARNRTAAISMVEEKHGIGRWFLLALVIGRTKVVSAYGYRAVAVALQADLETAKAVAEAELTKARAA
jgi:hypothetical protein